MRNEVTVHEVLFHDESRAGPAGDGTHIYRSTNLKAAQRFAAGQELYGQPAKVQTESVPRRLYERWLREGKIAS